MTGAQKKAVRYGQTVDAKVFETFWRLDKEEHLTHQTVGDDSSGDWAVLSRARRRAGGPSSGSRNSLVSTGSASGISER